MVERQAHDCTAHIRRTIRCAVAHPVIQHQQAGGTRLQRSGLANQLLVAGIVQAKHLLRQPVEDRTGRDLPALHQPLAVEQCIGVRPPDARHVDTLGGVHQLHHRRTADKQQFASARGAGAEHRHVGVDAALRHQRVAAQAQVTGSLGSQRPDAPAYLDHVRRQFFRQFRDAKFGIQLHGETLLQGVVVPFATGVELGCNPTAGELEVDPVHRFANTCGASVHLRLVLG